jgi:uncharacterized protein YqgC (DUF456 family)
MILVKILWESVVEVASRLPVNRQGGSVVQKWGAQVNQKVDGGGPEKS